MTAQLEHVNYTVKDTRTTADWMARVFGWKVRWEGDSIANGYTMHVGTADQYVALYSPTQANAPFDDNYQTTGGLNHIAVAVQDIDATEQRVMDAGFKPVNHADYEPGRRFYFHDQDGIEYEVVQYN